MFPEGAALTVSDPAPTRAAVKGNKDPGTQVTVRSYGYEITVTDSEGNPIQPAEGATVTLSFDLEEADDPNLTPRVLHEGAEIPCSAENGTVIAETDGFSKYTVEFFYDRKEYVLEGDSSVALSEILTEAGLTGEVTAVEVSNADLFSASRETGEWIVTAHKAFDTTEWMKVTIGGVTYEITVTDQGEVTVSYIKRSWNGRRVVETLVTDTAVPVPSDPSKMTEGRYYVNRNIDLSEKTTYIFLRGDTELILGSGYIMAVSGLFIPEGHTLTIYNEYGGMGGLLCQSSYEGAGIGGGVQHNSGNIVIHGGTVYAKGYDNAAGIGGAQYSSSPKITIYDGEIYAYGGTYGAGIGGGNASDGGTINIYGGTIVSVGGTDGAGIGGGNEGDGGTINIYGGDLP